MARYATIPTVVDAMQLDGTNYRSVYQWCADHGYKPEILTSGIENAPRGFRFSADVSDTDEPQIAEEDEWVLLHEDGKWEVMDSSSFEITYTEYRAPR